MARSFDGANDNITKSSGVVGIDVAQRTIAMWLYVESATGKNIFSTASAMSAGNFADTISSSAATSAWKFEYGYKWSTTNGSWQYNFDLNLNQWYHVAASYDRGSTSNDGVLYVDGVSVAVTETLTPAGTAKTGQVGYRVGESVTGANDYLGRAAELGFWDRILSADEIAGLGKGFSPLCYRAGLRLYLPLVGRSDPEPEMTQGASGTVTGAVYAEHPRIIYPRGRAA